jgi:hypothetical protein
MKTLSRYVLTLLMTLLGVCTAFAQAPPPDRPLFSPPELDQMLAPIALYPDSLLAQILMASTYPLEVVQAARWSRANPGLAGEQAVMEVDTMDWDPSVKSMVAFPQILAMMDERLDWTQRLGDAFLAQQDQVMNTVQALRARAYAAGNLRSSEQIFVEQQGDTILVEDPDPDLVYVPYYDPLVVYGPWWWPAYPPIYWRPWHGYRAYPGYAGFSWGIGIGLGRGFFFGGFDWAHRHANVIDRNPFYYHNVDRRPIIGAGNNWRHDPDHRHGVAYRDPATRQQYGRVGSAPDSRREYRGRDRPATEGRYPAGNRTAVQPDAPAQTLPGAPAQTQSAGAPAPAQPDNRTRAQPGFFAPRPEQRPSGTLPGTELRPNAGGVAAHQTAPEVRPGTDMRPNVGGAAARQTAPEARPTPVRPPVPGYALRPTPETRPHAFEGVGRGEDVRNSSARGNASVRVIAPPVAAPTQAPAPAPHASGNAHESHPSPVAREGRGAKSEK